MSENLPSHEISTVPRILFIGNSPNQLIREHEQYSWSALLRDMEGGIRDEIGNAGERDGDMPFPARSVRLKNFLKQKAEKHLEGEISSSVPFKTWEQWLESICKMESGKVHLLLKELMRNDFQAILTTNYDYTFERVLNESVPTEAISGGKKANAIRHHGKVWHLHGEAKDAESIIMTTDDYLEAVHLLKQENKKSERTWLDLFLESEVYVCGFGAYYEELLFWYALQRRFQLKPEERKTVVVYLFVAESSVARCDQLESLLLSYDVDVVKVYVTENQKNSGYAAAWFEVIGRLFAVVHHVGCLDKKASESVEKSDGKSAAAEVIRIIRSRTSTAGNPDRCWMNIPLEVFAKQGDIHFVCRINGEEYQYHCYSEKLRKSFETSGVAVIHNSPERYSFYLDYETGEIFKTVSANDVTPVISL